MKIRYLKYIAIAALLTSLLIGTITFAAGANNTWVQTNGKWTYIQGDGTLANGWNKVDGSWYFMDKSGIMQTGWLSYGGKWYYLNDSGDMAIGWKFVNGSWYYLQSSGAMQTGWVNYNGKYYYLNTNGDMAVNITTPDGYYVDADGVWDGKSLVDEISNIGNAEQAVIVTSQGFGTFTAEIHVYEKTNGIWNQVFNKMPAVIGMNGFASNKTEGDGKTPVGIFTFGTGFGKNSNPGTSINYRQVNYNDYWVDDSTSSLYNTWQTGAANGRWNSAERLLRSDWLYNYALVINYNTASPVPWKGSGIFLHEWRSRYSGTAGCIAVSESDLLQIIKWLNSAKNPVIIEGPVSEVLKM